MGGAASAENVQETYPESDITQHTLVYENYIAFQSSTWQDTGLDGIMEYWITSYGIYIVLNGVTWQDTVVRVRSSGLGVWGFGFRLGFEVRVQDGGGVWALESGRRLGVSVGTGSWMGPPQGKRAPRAGHTCIVILAREWTITDWKQCHGCHGFHN